MSEELELAVIDMLNSVGSAADALAWVFAILAAIAFFALLMFWSQ